MLYNRTVKQYISDQTILGSYLYNSLFRLAVQFALEQTLNYCNGLHTSLAERGQKASGYIHL